jgi:hypothetical protein
MNDIDSDIVLVVLLIPVLLLLWMKLPTSGGIYKICKFWMVAPGAMICLLCLPVCCYQLYHQAGARSRLAAFGLPISTYFSHCAGAQGGRPPRFVWCFSLKATPSDLMESYSNQARGAGWKAEKKNDGSVILARGQTRVAISLEYFNDERRFVIARIR